MILPQGSWWDLIPRAEFPDDLCVYLAIIVAIREKSMARLEEPIFLLFRQHPYPDQLAQYQNKNVFSAPTLSIPS